MSEDRILMLWHKREDLLMHVSEDRILMLWHKREDLLMHVP